MTLRRTALLVATLFVTPVGAAALPLSPSAVRDALLVTPLQQVEEGTLERARARVAVDPLVRAELDRLAGARDETHAMYLATGYALRWVEPTGALTADGARALAFLDTATAHGVATNRTRVDTLQTLLDGEKVALDAAHYGVARLHEAVGPHFASALGVEAVTRTPATPAEWAALADGIEDADWAHWRRTAERVTVAAQRERVARIAKVDVALTDGVAHAAAAFGGPGVHAASRREGSGAQAHTVRDVGPSLLLRTAAALDEGLTALVPRGTEYDALVAALAHHRDVQRAGGWVTLPTQSDWSLAARGPQITALRDRLTLSGYAAGPLDDTAWDDELRAQVMAFQQDHRLEPTGELDRETLRALREPVERRIATIVAALNDLRRSEAGVSVEGSAIRVNLPDFHGELHLDGEVAFRWRTIIGRTGRIDHTPELSSGIHRLEFNPSWVPTPRLARNLVPNERTGIVRRGGRLVQLPGPHNALGVVKFLFPNPYSVYLHDTNQRSLFSRASRAFSSGCVRVDQPEELAARILAIDRGLTVESARTQVATMIESGRTHRVELAQPLPIHLEYRLVRAATGGLPEFFPDLYGRMEQRLDDLMARPDIAAPPARLAPAGIAPTQG